MGMFTWVKPDPTILPEECRHLSGWQTKSMFDDHHCETLEIASDGRLIHIWHDYEWREDESAFLGGYLVPVKEHRDELHYHGALVFYVSDDATGEWFEFVAKFTNGVVDSLKRVEVE